jgi:hypothetical protein
MHTGVAQESMDQNQKDRKRNQIFLSHASPEDNEFTLWLTLQLANEGYAVWSDLTKLLGGEEFWRNIEQTIREGTTKFLYVLSRNSNYKQGPLQELQLAHAVMRQQNLTDFIIPLLIDDLAVEEVNIQLSMLNVIAFNQGWAAGLNNLLRKLEQEGVAKNDEFTPGTVGSWWRQQFDANSGLLAESEEYLSNWFPIQALPQNICFHVLDRTRLGKFELSDNLPYPAFQFNQYMVSFAPATDFTGQLGSFMRIRETNAFPTKEFLEGAVAASIVDYRQRRDLVARLLGLGWQRLLQESHLPQYEFASGASCFYFTLGAVSGDKLSFTGAEGKSTSRHVVGYKTVQKASFIGGRKRYWHFAVQAKPLLYPTLAYIIKPHVLFSYDGKQIWDSKSRLHKARRSQCRHWWNAEWRDRILATMSWLAKETNSIEVRFGSGTTITVSTVPCMFKSPVSYQLPDREIVPEDDDYGFYEDDDFDEEEELELKDLEQEA